MEDTLVDTQAAHGSRVANKTYARNVKDAPGHVAMRKEQYRIVSQEWHEFLNFDSCRESLKRAATDDSEEDRPPKQPFLSIVMDDDDDNNTDSEDINIPQAL
ncbi:hypothetical protein LPJ72_006242 [Coemansia sp. Benny D160-2]|nr:hypothetical protein LPJ72_006242 [Coemansia sp. Benny D160-2]